MRRLKAGSLLSGPFGQLPRRKLHAADGCISQMVRRPAQARSFARATIGTKRVNWAFGLAAPVVAAAVDARTQSEFVGGPRPIPELCHQRSSAGRCQSLKQHAAGCKMRFPRCIARTMLSGAAMCDGTFSSSSCTRPPASYSLSAQLSKQCALSSSSWSSDTQFGQTSQSRSSFCCP